MLPFLATPSESLSWQQQRTGKGCGLKAEIPLQQGTWMDLACSCLEILTIHWVHNGKYHMYILCWDMLCWFSKHCHTNTSHSYSTLGRIGVGVCSLYVHRWRSVCVFSPEWSLVACPELSQHTCVCVCLTSFQSINTYSITIYHYHLRLASIEIQINRYDRIYTAVQSKLGLHKSWCHRVTVARTANLWKRARPRSLHRPNPMSII